MPQRGMRGARYRASLTTLEEASHADPASPWLTAPSVEQFEGMLTASPLMRRLFQVVARAAPTPASVLLLGETGTGKELVARAIHRRSARPGRFVAVDCGAIPPGLIEAELFGHERGAFTGAAGRKLGLFRHADRGTILLDEIGNLPLAAQATLLRTLQEGTVRSVGGQGEVPVDVRVIAATSAELDQAVEAGEFRPDLLYRLDVLRVQLPPLRERPEDVPALFELFGRELARRYGLEPPRPGAGFLAAMRAHDWPGNVRQLENFTERLLLLGRPAWDSAADFQALIGVQRTPRRPAPPAFPGAEPGRGRSPRAEPEPEPDGRIDLSLDLTGFLAQQERAYLLALLRDTGGAVKATAARAGVDRRTILRKLQQHQINRRRFIPRGAAGR